MRDQINPNQNPQFVLSFPNPNATHASFSFEMTNINPNVMDMRYTNVYVKRLLLHVLRIKRDIENVLRIGNLTCMI
jgi:hypothetical protein